MFSVTSVWPVQEMDFTRCPSVSEYLARVDPRERKVGPVIFCSQNVNLDYNFCVQKHMNILPAKKNSSWKDACKNLREMFEKCPRIVSGCLTEKEYKHFVDEFLIDIRATVIAMEDVCPIAKKSTLGRYLWDHFILSLKPQWILSKRLLLTCDVKMSIV